MENFIGERVSKMLYTLDDVAGQGYVLITALCALDDKPFPNHIKIGWQICE